MSGMRGHNKQDCPKREGEWGGGESQWSEPRPGKKQQFTSGPDKHAQSKTTKTAPVSAVLRASGYKTALREGATETERSASEELRRSMRTTCTSACRGGRWHRCITAARRR